MKTEKLCENCAKTYKSSAKNSRFCSTACRVYAYRKRNNIPDPVFIQDHRKPKKKVSRKIQEKIKVPTAEYKELLELEEGFIAKAEHLKKRKKSLITKINKLRITSEANYLNIKELSEINYKEVSPQVEKLLQKLQAISQQIDELEILFDLSTSIKRKIRKYDMVTQTVDRLIDAPVDDTTVRPYALPKSLIKREIPIYNNSYKTVVRRNDNNQKYKALNFTGHWEAIFGKPAINFSCIIEKAEEKGLLRFILDLSTMLAENFGNVAFFSSRLATLELLGNQSLSRYLYPILCDNIQQVRNYLKLKDFEFVFIDIPGSGEDSFIELTPLLKKFAHLILVSDAGAFDRLKYDLSIKPSDYLTIR